MGLNRPGLYCRIRGVDSSMIKRNRLEKLHIYYLSKNHTVRVNPAASESAVVLYLEDGKCMTRHNNDRRLVAGPGVRLIPRWRCAPDQRHPCAEGLYCVLR